jgi:uncharacterized protein
MKTVFLDTVGLLASWDASDQWHTSAISALDAIEQPHIRTVTTTFVLLECGNAAARRPFRPLVDRMRAKLEIGNKLIVPTQQDWEQAWTAYRAGGSAHAGIVDHVSFVVMRRLAITDVFSNDRHFKAAGFNTLF